MPTNHSPHDQAFSTARTIVNQLANLWEVPIDIRQATNDQCDEFVVKLLNVLLNEVAEHEMSPDIMRQIMVGLAKEGKPVGHMQCNACGYVEAYSPTDVTTEEFQKNGKATIQKMKEHFANNGWKTSWGYDLCLECAKTKVSYD